MQKCPNCGRPTYRTEDWVCQWCGYPLLSKAYKKISKTFKQLQEERRKPAVSEPVPVVTHESEPAPLPLVSEPAQETMPEPESVPVAEQEIAPQPEPEEQAEPEVEQQQSAEPEPEPVSEPESVPVAEQEVASQPEPEEQAEPEVEQQQPVEPAPEPQPVQEQVPEAAVPLSVPNTVTVEELDAAYQANGIAADAGNQGKVLTVSGVVDKVVVNDSHEIYYCILAGAERKVVWNIRCTFDRRNGAELKKISGKQRVAVQGKYSGYSKNIILKDCVLLG